MLLQNKKVAIIGGGPGGLTLARLLQMKGVDVTVYERDLNKDARVQGTTLDLHEDSGLKALRHANLLEAFKEHYRPGADRMTIVNAKAEVFYSDHEGKPEADFGNEHFRPEIDRGPLRKLLLASLQEDTVVWDSQFISAEKPGDGWQLHFKNNTSAYADIVIGADGANSRIRPYITDIKPFYTGISGLLGSVHDPEQTTPYIYELLKGGKIMAYSGGKCFIAASKGDGSMSFYISYRTSEYSLKDMDVTDKQQILSWFKNNFSGWSKTWHDLLEHAETPLMPIPIYCMPVNQSWEAQPNLTIIGDAAHLMPPFAGEGVNMAMLDALELSECLAREEYKSLSEAISAYEINMRKRAALMAQESLDNGELMHSENALQDMVSFFKGHNMAR